MSALDEAKQRILSGPDTPGKRFLRARQVKEIVAAPESRQEGVTRAMIDRLRELPPAPQGPQPFDPDNDPQLFDPEIAAACHGKDPDDPDNY